jgi:DNA-binding response OmpR family regulator
MKTAAPTPRIADRLRAQRRSDLVGRQGELTCLLAAVREDGPIVSFVLGIGGLGKTTLLEALGEQLDLETIPWRRLDCGAIEPTAAGLLDALGDSLGRPLPTVAAAAEALAAIGPRMVLAFDQYENFRLLDGWFRQELVPALPASVRVLLLARDAAVQAWTDAPGWDGLVQALHLPPLSDPEARQILQRHQLDPLAVERLLRLAQGHPLALLLGARAASGLNGAGEPETRPIIDVLAPLFLQDVADPAVRRLLEAACLIRRATRSMLAAMLPDAANEDRFEALRQLPFTEAALDGLAVHDTVRTAIAGSLRALDPSRYQELRARAWGCLRQELASASKRHLWRYTADLLYLVDRPELREALFPRDMPVYSVEVARADDGPAILDIVLRHDPGDVPPLTRWWQALPRNFRVVRDARGQVAAFSVMCLAQQVSEDLRQSDLIVDRWCAHLREPNNDLTPDTPILFSRRILVGDAGEDPSPLRSACWLDAKRVYFENLQARRIYLTTRQPEQVLLLAPMGFQLPAALAHQRPSGDRLHTLLLEFGPNGVLGWMAGLVDTQFAAPVVSPACVLDQAARALSVDGRRVHLTRLEYGVMSYLLAREDRVVSRDDLLRDVWGQSFGGSNVVDAVMKSLRKKLGQYGSSIATVTGHGYRFSGFSPAIARGPAR